MKRLPDGKNGLFTILFLTDVFVRGLFKQIAI